MTFLPLQGNLTKLMKAVRYSVSLFKMSLNYSALDQIHVMTYDYHGAWETFTGVQFHTHVYIKP